MASSNKSLVFLVAIPLLMALLASSAAAGRVGGGYKFQQESDGQYCGRVPVCKEDLCSATCAVHGIAGVGQCNVVGGEPTCCCVPTEPSPSVGLPAGSFQLHQEADGQYCHRVKVCKEDQCSGTCAVLGVPGVGQCKVGGEPTCCCVPSTPSASVSLPAASFQFQQEADGQYCHPVKACKEDQCSGTCAVLGVPGVGQCKVDSGVPTCCCVPAEPSASNGVHTTGLRVDPFL